MPRVYTSARERILDAAERVIVERGVGQLGVEAVARAAGVSKGGFFHHFATREALLAAILERLVAETGRAIAEAAARDPEPRGAALRAQIDLSFESATTRSARWRTLIMAVIEASAAHPSLLERSRELAAESVVRDTAQGIPAGRSLVIQLALDGFWLAQALGTIAFDRRQLRALREALHALARPDDAAPSPARTPAARTKPRDRAPARRTKGGRK